MWVKVIPGQTKLWLVNMSAKTQNYKQKNCNLIIDEIQSHFTRHCHRNGFKNLGPDGVTNKGASFFWSLRLESRSVCDDSGGPVGFSSQSGHTHTTSLPVNLRQEVRRSSQIDGTTTKASRFQRNSENINNNKRGEAYIYLGARDFEIWTLLD